MAGRRDANVSEEVGEEEGGREEGRRERTSMLAGSSGGLGPLGAAKSISTCGDRTAAKNSTVSLSIRAPRILDSGIRTVVWVSCLGQEPSLHTTRTIPSQCSLYISRGKCHGESAYRFSTGEGDIYGGEDEEDAGCHVYCC